MVYFVEKEEIMEPRVRLELQEKASEVGKKWQALLIVALEIDKELAEAARVGALKSKAAWEAVYEIKEDVDELYHKVHVERHEQELMEEKIREAVLGDEMEV